ncbi:MAG: hypothetical protein A3F72_04210 [Bacteroidetes bacterium RIFCSPLOWO2_12_FULL_35_15]|nr:MAG: hypothetical protein A3F72_04210 [Bacteroidetes bacterium RIFCSPLOWO2_12_FULL_35_15]
MKKNKIFLYLLFFAIIGCKGQDSKNDTLKKVAGITFEEKQKKDISKIIPEQQLTIQNGNFNFRIAAKKATPGVVHIKSTYSANEYFGYYHDDFWYRFFSQGDTSKPQSDASGVIVSSDGYIVTNEHVVVNAESIEVILHNQKSYKAKVIGIDPETDLALLKIQESNLSFIEFGNSDEVEVGDWVLAVGNPFNLTSTVTAGIVSAKARNINILREKGAVESYIQTDAAINPGNSGGALVDYNGKLIGVNSAIATPTGAYAGYSFAIPINIVKKIIDDLLISGKVKRGYLGIVLKELTDTESKHLNTDITVGVYIDSLIKGGAAIQADLQLKDIIIAIDGHPIKTSAQFQEIMVQHHPNEKIMLTIIRKGKEKRIPVVLNEYEGTAPNPIVAKTEFMEKLGIRLEQLSEKEKKRMKLSGLKVVEVAKGIIYNNTNIKKGFIITKVNGRTVNTEDEFIKAFENNKGIITIEGGYPNFTGIFFYTFGID